MSGVFLPEVALLVEGPVLGLGEDLDVLIDLCDRIFVLCGGKGNGMLDGRSTTKEEVGMRMTKLENGGEEK